jgi:phytoene desaturase
MVAERSVAVIGSGFGGLAAAIRLAAAGFRVVMFEARDRPGGRAYVYQQDGLTFDAGPTVITAPPAIEELFTVAGERMADHVQMLPVRPFYRLLWTDGAALDYEGDAAHMHAQIAALAPGDVAGYDRFLDYSRRLFSKGYDELVAAPFLRFADMLRVAPDLLRLRADRSVYRAVSRFVRDDKLREALSFHALLVGGNPFETSALYALIPFLERKWGVWFPRGGTGALVRALASLFARLGGELRLSAPVRGIALETQTRDGRVRHRVRTDAGEESFDAVVSNADLHHTYATLYDGVPAARETRARLEKMAWSMSLLVVYFGAHRQWPGLAHHTVLFGPRYEGLLREVFHGPHVPEDFSLYLHAPTVTDPSLAPPGATCFYVLAPVPHLGNANVDWHTEGPRLADRVLASLERRVLPGLSASLATRRIFTPVDFRGQLAAFQGSAFSLAPRLGQSAWFRPHNRDPHIPGLYIVGAGTHPGAGVPGVINSGKATAGLVLRDLGDAEVRAAS